MTGKTTIIRRMGDAFTMFVVSGLSLLLLMYVAFGEGQRTYQQFHLEKLVAQGRVIQSAINNFLRPGLPLRQYVGFSTRAGTILSSDPSIASISVFGTDQRAIFAAGLEGIPLLSEAEDKPKPKQNGDGASMRQSNDYIQVVLPLRNRYEVVGHLAVTMPRDLVGQRVQENFEPLLVVAAVLSAIFGLLVAVLRPEISRSRTPWLQVSYAVTFLVMACFVISTFVNLYSEGAQAKTKALADSLGQRLTDIVGFNLNIEEIRGLDKIFHDYRKLNPDISAAGLSVNGVVKIHTDKSRINDRWVKDKRDYEYVVEITPDDPLRDIRVAVALPVDVVFRQIVRSVKNFAALFVASAFFAGLFLQMAGSVQRYHQDEAANGGDSTAQAEAQLSLVKPVFFVAVFIEHLMYSFLPQFVNEVIGAAGLSSSLVSAPFMAYYLFFALALVPAGHFAQQYSPRPLMYIGVGLSALGIAALALPPDFTLIVLARSLAGIGQGMLFIGVQSYILMTASPDRKTQGASIIVFGFQGGMISGMAIGSLLVTYIGPQGVFSMATAIALVLAFYTMIVVPAIKARESTDLRLGIPLKQLGLSMIQMFRSGEFLKTMLLIGIPAKAVLTGIVIFALPLLLAQRNFPQEDIGQIIMVYAAGVILASGYMSRLVDRTGHTYLVLFWGAVISGLGVIMIGLIDWAPIANAPSSSMIQVAVLVFGVAILGMAHGFINAPVVTHVAESEFAQRTGKSAATATYRFVERLGHVAGPIVVGQLFLLYGQQAEILTWMGSFIALAGVVFIVLSARPRSQTINRETSI